MSAEVEQPRRDPWFLVGIAVLSILCFAFLAKPYSVGIYGDDACYLLQAMGMTDSGLCPTCAFDLKVIPYARGWSLVLAPFVYLFGEDFEAYRLISGALSVLGVMLAAELCRRSSGRIVGGLMGAVLLTSDGFLEHGTTLMAEPLYFALLMGLLWQDRKEPSKRSDFFIGCLAGLCAITRAEGAIVPVAVLLDSLFRKRWKGALMRLGPALTIYLGARLMWPVKMQYSGQFQYAWDGIINSKLQYLTSWVLNQAMMLGSNFVIAPSVVERALGFLLLGLVVFSFLQQKERPRRLRLDHWVILGTLGALFLWTFYSPRYWTALLPIWLLASMSGLPYRARTALLSSLLVAQIIGFTQHSYQLRAQELSRQVELWQQLDSLGANETISTPYPCRAHLMSHRPWAFYNGADSLGVLVRNLKSRDADVLIWERHNNFVRGAQGQTISPSPPHLDLWMERSGLFQVVYQNQAGVIARVKVDPARLAAAFALWQQAIAAPSAAQRLPLLEQGLREVPDFPELRALWFLTAAEVPAVPREEVAEAMLRYVQQYPHDFVIGAICVSMLPGMNLSQDADKIRALCLAEAERLGDPEAIARFRQSVANGPSPPIP